MNGMNGMNEIILNSIYLILTAIVTFIANAVIRWIGQKTKNEKLAANLIQAVNIVTNAVKSTTQTYVDSLKKSGNFTLEAQAEALRQTKETATTQISPEVKNYIMNTFGDFDIWLTTQIEAALNSLKQKKIPAVTVTVSEPIKSEPIKSEAVIVVGSVKSETVMVSEPAKPEAVTVIKLT